MSMTCISSCYGLFGSSCGGIWGFTHRRRLMMRSCLSFSPIRTHNSRRNSLHSWSLMKDRHTFRNFHVCPCKIWLSSLTHKSPKTSSFVSWTFSRNSQQTDLASTVADGTMTLAQSPFRNIPFLLHPRDK